jgi:tetratricopeptide (TPR) repeat protein
MKQSIMAITILTLILVSTIAQADDISDAKNFRGQAMLQPAIIKYEQAVAKNPNDAEAFFQLGKCYALNCNLDAAEAAFARAIQIKSGYAYQVAEIYVRAGFDRLQYGDKKTARNLLWKATKYRGTIGKELAQELLTTGKEVLNQGMYGAEIGYMELAAEFNPALRPGIGKLYYDLGHRATDMECLEYYVEAKKYVPYDREAANRLIQIATDLAMDPQREEFAKNYKQDVKRYLEGSYVDEKLPEYVFYERGNIYTLPIIKKGQWLPFQVTFKEGDNDYAFTKGAKIKLHFSDGTIIDYGKGELAVGKNNSRFRIEAYADFIDNPLKMRVR